MSGAMLKTDPIMLFEKLSRLPNVTPINNGDYSLFQEYFNNENTCHANSWLYMLRATRDDRGNPGYKYFGRGVLIGIGLRNDTIYLTRPMGKKRHDVIVDLCRQLDHPTIILKRLDSDLYYGLKDTGHFADVRNHNILEDDAYPETIVEVEKIITSDEKSGHADKLRKKARGFEQHFNKLFVKTEVTEKDLNPLLSALLRMADNVPDKYTSYAHMMKDLLQNRKTSKEFNFFVYYMGKEIHGIDIVEFLDPDSVGLYCAVTSKAFPGITEWIDYDFFGRIFSMGVKRVYLGGSETQGVYQYIRKLSPSFPSYKMYSLKYSSISRSR